MTSPSPGLLRCHKCGATHEHTLPELVKFAGKGWPQCCGETVALFAPVPTQAPPVQPPPNA